MKEDGMGEECSTIGRDNFMKFTFLSSVENCFSAVWQNLGVNGKIVLNCI
jgi:hypothetical protein